jgi:quinol monooxygenase YgiN
MRYVVLAELRARPERVAELDAFMARHAAASREEPGCLVFDVCREPGNAAAFVLYEVYEDEAASPRGGRHFSTNTSTPSQSAGGWARCRSHCSR